MVDRVVSDWEKNFIFSRAGPQNAPSQPQQREPKRPALSPSMIAVYLPRPKNPTLGKQGMRRPPPSGKRIQQLSYGSSANVKWRQGLQRLEDGAVRTSRSRPRAAPRATAAIVVGSTGLSGVTSMARSAAESRGQRPLSPNCWRSSQSRDAAAYHAGSVGRWAPASRLPTFQLIRHCRHPASPAGPLQPGCHRSRCLCERDSRGSHAESAPGLV